jgi:hypothetical protein
MNNRLDLTVAVTMPGPRSAPEAETFELAVDRPAGSAS